jgi:hypothetical protein
VSVIDHLGDPGVAGRIILKLIFRKWDGGMDWTEMAQDRDKCRALGYAVMNLQFPKMGRIFLLENRLTSEGLCFLEKISK